MSKNLIIVFVVLLVIIPAAFIAIKLLTPSQSLPTLTKTNVPNQVSSTTAPPSTTNNNQNTTYNPEADQRYVLANVSKENKSTKEAKDFATALSNSAVATDNLDVSACKPNPVILRIEFNKQLSVKNSDSVAHTLVINSRSFKVSAGSSVNIATTDFGKDGTVYPYACDDNPQAGVIWVSK